MRIGLIILNFFLIGLIAYGAFERVREATPGDVYSVKKRNPKTPLAIPLKTENSANTKTSDPAAASANIIEQNIFDASRCPNARVAGRGRNAQVEMTLVGTFTIGESSGAIILQKARNLNMMQNWNNQFRAPGGQNTMNNQSMTNITPQPPGMLRQRFGVTQTENTEENTVYQQYVRVGETLSNGYTLSGVTRIGATLTRGSEKLELQLLEPSKAATTGTTQTASNTVPGSPFADMTPEQRQQFFERMREMRNQAMSGGAMQGGMQPGGQNMGGNNANWNLNRNSNTGDASSTRQRGGNRNRN